MVSGAVVKLVTSKNTIPPSALPLPAAVVVERVLALNVSLQLSVAVML